MVCSLLLAPMACVFFLLKAFLFKTNPEMIPIKLVSTLVYTAQQRWGRGDMLIDVWPSWGTVLMWKLRLLLGISLPHRVGCQKPFWVFSSASVASASVSCSSKIRGRRTYYCAMLFFNSVELGLWLSRRRHVRANPTDGNVYLGHCIKSISSKGNRKNLGIFNASLPPYRKVKLSTSGPCL